MLDGQRQIEGALSGKGCRMAIAISRFNELVGKSLLDGCLGGLSRAGVAAADVHVAWVPGAFELPLTAQRLCRSGQYDAVICLGVVIKGDTPHFDYVCAQAAGGILQTSLQENLPVIFGVLTTHTLEQAQARAGAKGGNKGFDAAMSAVEMVQLLRRLPDGKER